MCISGVNEELVGATLVGRPVIRSAVRRPPSVAYLALRDVSYDEMKA